jgi:membrane glycosyltransferase
MLLPLTLAVPFTVLTGHPRAGRAVAWLGLLRTPEETRPPRPLVRAAERGSFVDLAPIAAPARRPATHPSPQRWRSLRHLPASAIAAVALLTFAVPRPGIAPELPPQWRAAQEVVLNAYWRDEPSLPLTQQVVARKRTVRDKPARMIDDALRQRAFEAVERALANELPPI